MKPGLHPLSCSRCGAPLDPTERSKGDVVTCRHCDQPHLWVAPGKVEAQPRVPSAIAAAAPVARKGAPLLAIGVGVGLLVLLLVVGAFAAYAFRGGADGRASSQAVVTADMPIALGDELQMTIDNHSCQVLVERLLDDGRIEGVPCRSEERAPIARSLLTAAPLGAGIYTAESGDIVIARIGGSWARRRVVGPEPGKQLRLRSLAGGGAEDVVPELGVLRVQPRTQYGPRHAPLPDTAPLAAGDVVWVRGNNTLAAHRVEQLGDEPELLSGFESTEGVFKPTEQPPVRLPRSRLLVPIVRANEPLRAGDVVLVKQGAGWHRGEVARDEGTAVKLVGETTERPKENMLLVRRAGAPADHPG